MPVCEEDDIMGDPVGIFPEKLFSGKGGVWVAFQGKADKHLMGVLVRPSPSQDIWRGTQR